MNFASNEAEYLDFCGVDDCLERRTQMFSFILDSHGKIISKQLVDISTGYHLLQPTELPD